MRQKRSLIDTSIILLAAILLLVFGILKLTGFKNDIITIPIMIFSVGVFVYFYKRGKL